MDVIKKKLKKIKKTKHIELCSYCSYTKALPDDNLCQDCRDMINNASKGFII